MKELEAKLAKLEGDVSAFFGKLQSSVGGTKGRIESVDQGPIGGLDAALAEVEAVRAFMLGELTKVETRAASMRPD